MVVPDANPSRHVAFLKQSCGFSTQARNGTCCRRATRTTKLCIGGSRRGGAGGVFLPGWRGVVTSFGVEGHLTEENKSFAQPLFFARGGGCGTEVPSAGK